MKESACYLYYTYICIVNHVQLYNCYLIRKYFFIIDALSEQVEELKGLLKTLIKGKQKEMNPKDAIIDFADVTSRKGHYSSGSSKSLGYGQAGSSKNVGYGGSSSETTKKYPPSSSPSSKQPIKKNPPSPKQSIKPSSKKSIKKYHKKGSSSDRSSSSSSSTTSSSTSPALSPVQTPSFHIFYEDMDKDIRNALRVTRSLYFGCLLYLSFNRFLFYY
jgi:hypothetical protein